jgi:hypothetical protein
MLSAITRFFLPLVSRVFYYHNHRRLSTYKRIDFRDKQAQNFQSDLGKVIRINDDSSIPKDNSLSPMISGLASKL